MTSRKIFYGLLISTTVILAMAFCAYSFKKEITAQRLPVYGEVNNFHLEDARGEKFSLANLQGKIWVADFFFTSCSGICPLMTKNMGYLQSATAVFDNVDLVSISVNPENDTPQTLSQYAQSRKANPARWHFLTGSRDEIKKLVLGSFKIGSVEDPIFHSDRFVLVDQKFQIRGFYDGTKKESIVEVIKAIELLRKQKHL